MSASLKSWAGVFCATISGVQLQLDGLASLGLQSVTIGVGFPILYQPFYQYNNDPQDYAKVLSLYQSVMAEVHKSGMKAVIETSVMFPNFATDLPLSAYYATLSASQVTAGRAQVAQTIAQSLQPDWLNLGSAPDTQAALLGLKNEYTPQQYATEISTIVTQLRVDRSGHRHLANYLTVCGLVDFEITLETPRR